MNEAEHAEALERVLRLMNVGDTAARCNAVWQAASLADPAAVDAILLRADDDGLEWFEDDESPYGVLVVQVTVAEVLGTLADPRAIPTLLRLAEKSNSEVRRAATVALGKSRDARGVAKLIQFTRDGDWNISRSNEESCRDIRLEAVRALGEIGDQRAVERLSELAADHDPDYREAAIEALRKIAAKKKGGGRASTLGGRDDVP